MTNTTIFDAPDSPTYADLLRRFRDPESVAAALRVAVNTISKMKSRGHIHSRHWAALQAVAQAQGVVITDEDLAQAEKQFHAAKRQPTFKLAPGRRGEK